MPLHCIVTKSHNQTVKQRKQSYNLLIIVTAHLVKKTINK